MRADRLLSILLLLQVHRQLTAGELARRLEVSERTIHRDMVALGMAGIPVMAERGTGGGWRLLEEYRTNLTGMNAAEIQALFLTRPSRLMADLGMEQASDAALIKLLAALPAISRQNAEDIRQRIHIDVAGWGQREDAVPLLPIIQQAVWQQRRLRFTYGYEGEDAGERQGDPLGLVAKGSVWYMIAAIEGQPRTYRVSRVRSAELLDELFERPPGFDLAGHWEESSARFSERIPRFPATLRVAAGALGAVRAGGRYTRVEREEPPGADGWSRVVVLFEDDHSAREFILSYGPRVEVIEPEMLRAAIRDAARATVALYARGDEATP
ncbi:MAG TPA: WYL domain-containing protein [Ktedonobacterales bacterium]|nr:WYL domain-containing protein [Ktedonobacterales bacterium]